MQNPVARCRLGEELYCVNVFCWWSIKMCGKRTVKLEIPGGARMAQGGFLLSVFQTPL